MVPRQHPPLAVQRRIHWMSEQMQQQRLNTTEERKQQLKRAQHVFLVTGLTPEVLLSHKSIPMS